MSASGMMVDPKNSDPLFAASRHGGIRITRDQCQTCHRIDRGLSAQLVNTLEINLNNAETLHAGTAENGTYASFNRGTYGNQLMTRGRRDDDLHYGGGFTI